MRSSHTGDDDTELFRPSRPDSIETCPTSRQPGVKSVPLFRPSRPDSIETGSSFNNLNDVSNIVPAF